MRRGLVWLGILSVQGGFVLAQNTVVAPADYTTIEAESWSSDLPFSGGITRYQVVYHRDYLLLPNAAMITATGVRPDGLRSSTGQRIQLEIWFGHTTKFGVTGTNRLTSTFDTNYDGSLTRVFDLKTVTLPNLTPPATPPSTTPVMVTLDRPFTYDATRNLVVEYRVFANDNANNRFTYAIDTGFGMATNTRFGQSCPTSTGRLPTHLTTGPKLHELAVSRGWRLFVSNGAASSPAAVFMGIDNSNSFGLPLPFDLAVIGAPACFLNVELRLSMPVALDSSGALSTGITAPPDPRLYRSTIYTQVAMVDVFANNLGVITTNGASSTVGADYQLTSFAFLAVGNANATVGNVTTSGVVSLFQYQ